MAEPVFRALEIALPVVAGVNGTRLIFDGLANIPERGGAVLAVNHTGYLDWYPAAIAALRRHRRLRFMIKTEMTGMPVIGAGVRHLGLIPVDRAAGAGGYAAALQRLRDGELVGINPESTISRSFELLEFKTGAVRLAHAAGVPLIPVIVWGAQRIWTKDRPRKLWRNQVPVLVRIGVPWQPGRPGADVAENTADLRETMTAMLEQAQLDYPHPAGAFWVPRRLGGTAPSPEQAETLRAAELADRERRRSRS